MFMLILVSVSMLDLKGEIFGGIQIGTDENDTETLMGAMENCCSCNSHLQKGICSCNESGKVSVVDVLSAIRGPWAIIYWQVTVLGKFMFIFIRICTSFFFFSFLSYYNMMYTIVQEHCGLVEMHLACGVNLFIGQWQRILVFCGVEF